MVLFLVPVGWGTVAFKSMRAVRPMDSKDHLDCTTYDRRLLIRRTTYLRLCYYGKYSFLQLAGRIETISLLLVISFFSIPHGLTLQQKTTLTTTFAGIGVNRTGK
jgi:hypothetical protein